MQVSANIPLMCPWNSYIFMDIFMFGGVGSEVVILYIEHCLHEEKATYWKVATRLPESVNRRILN